MNSSPALPFITVRLRGLGRGLLPCLAVLCMHRHYDHEGNITVASRGNQKLGVGVDCGIVGAHLSNTSGITSLRFISSPSKMCRAWESRCLSTGFALSLNLRLLLHGTHAKLALIMSRNPVLNASIKKGPWVLGRLCDKTIGVLKRWNAYLRPRACTSWTLDPPPHPIYIWHASSELCFLIPEPIHPFTHFETMKRPQWLLGPDSIGTSRKGETCWDWLKWWKLLCSERINWCFSA